jgi:hypothetical protein
MIFPTMRTAALAAAAAWLPGLAGAQSPYCLDTLAAVCGDLPVNQCMVAEDIPALIPGECVGDVQMLFEMAREAGGYYEEQAPAPSAGGGYDAGYSFGGNLRAGPRDEYQVVGSLPEGA